MIVTNQTTSDIYFGPLHLGPGVGTQLTIDDTTATSLYLTDDFVADAVNNAYNSGKITVSGAAAPFPRPTGVPSLLHGTGNPEGLVYAPQGSVYMRRDGVQSNGGVLYLKTTGVTLNTGWMDIPTAAGTTVALPTGAISIYGAAAAPSGWLLCDGSAVSRTTYSVLFGVIGTTYGAGDGSTTFNLPDLRGRVIAGYAASGGHADVSTLGNNDGVTLAYRRPKHNHSVNITSSSVVGTQQPIASGTSGATDTNFSTGVGTQTFVKVGPQTGAEPNDTPGYLVLNYIIKT
jgi:microcystin-dependent protein